MFNFKTAIQKDTGIVIENRPIDNTTNQVSIKINNFKYSPNEGNLYLVSFRGIGRSNKHYRTLELRNIPDENNLLTFNFQKSNQLDALIPGVHVKIRGPFTDSTKKAS